MYTKITLFTFCCLFFTSCIFKDKETLTIQFSGDSTQLFISGIEEANLYQLKQQLKKDTTITALINVIEIDDENPDQDKEIKGKLLIEKSNVVFNPSSQFVKGKTYLVRTVLNVNFGKTSDILKSDLGHKIKEREIILKR